MRQLSAAAFVLLAALACQPVEQPLTDADRAEIEATVREVFQAMVDGMNEDDVGKILSAYSPDILYTGKGETVEGWEPFEAQVRNAYGDPNAEPWHHRIDEIRVKVLSEDYAMVSAWGASGPEYEFGYSVTDLLHRTPDGWLIVNEHESDGASPAGEG